MSLRVAASAAERDVAIGGWLASLPPTQPPAKRVIVVEGALFDRRGPQDVPLVGLPAGCPCCTGLLTLRVALVRTMRRFRPESVLLLVTTEEPLPRLRRMLEDGELGMRFEVER